MRLAFLASVLSVSLYACSSAPEDRASSSAEGALSVVPVRIDPCLLCTTEEICYRNGNGTSQCIANPDPCAKCTSTQICYRSGNSSPPTAYCVDDPCAKCAPDQVCYRSGNGSPGSAYCVTVDPCAKCAPGQICYRSGNSSPPSAVCINP
jgi:hypothetical protein